MKKLITLTLFALLFSAAAYAQENVVIDEISYEGNGTFEVDVKDTSDSRASIVWTEQETLSVRDSAGNTVPAVIVKDDHDTYKIFVQNAKKNDLYSFEIKNAQLGDKKGVDLQGVMKAAHEWTSAPESKKQTKPAPRPAEKESGLYIYEMEFDDGDEVEIEFRDLYSPYCNITWDKSVKITATDSAGKNHPVKILGYDNDDIKLRISGVIKNEKYRVVLQNIRYNGETVTLAADVVAVNGWKYKILREGYGFRDSTRGHMNLCIKELEFEHNNELDIEFADLRNKRCDISWMKNEKFIVKDASGKIYLTKPVKLEHDGATVIIEGLTPGQDYIITVEDVSYEGKDVTLTAPFRAKNGWEYRNRGKHVK